MQKHIGIIGLGKMGENIARRLTKKGWRVEGFDPKEGSAYRTVSTLRELVASLPAPRVVLVMVPAGAAVNGVLFGAAGLVSLLAPRDIVIDGGNSFYKDTIARGKKIGKKVHFLDAGISGGPGGALRGACIMVGGDKKTFVSAEPLLSDMARKGGLAFFPGLGAGHFVKMIHNGIEYGMMQALAEGVAILKTSPYTLNLLKVARLYNEGSVIESRLVGWLADAFERYGENLGGVSGSVAHTGEGKWTAQTARTLGVPARIIEESFKFRVRSGRKPSYTGKVLSALRNQFGGHSIKH